MGSNSWPNQQQIFFFFLQKRNKQQSYNIQEITSRQFIYQLSPGNVHSSKVLWATYVQF